jgi:hypothetical protein
VTSYLPRGIIALQGQKLQNIEKFLCPSKDESAEKYKSLPIAVKHFKKRG